MGREARCPVRLTLADGAHEGDARIHLDNDALSVSGPARSSVRARIARTAIRGVTSSGGTVVVEWSDGAVAFDAGDTADAWMRALREPPKSLVDRLGIKPTWKVSVLGLDAAHAVAVAITERAASTSVGRLAKGCDVIVLVVERPGDLTRIAKALPSLAPAGVLWVLHPRGVRDVADRVIFAAGKEAGLVATKVARIDDVLTGEMLVRPKRDRGQTP